MGAYLSIPRISARTSAYRRVTTRSQASRRVPPRSSAYPRVPLRTRAFPQKESLKKCEVPTVKLKLLFESMQYGPSKRVHSMQGFEVLKFLSLRWHFTLF